MGLRHIKPTTPGQRGMVLPDFAEITKKTPEKSLLAPRKRSGGRNHIGDTTSRFRGGGHKKMYRVIDFKRQKDGMMATVAAIEYDPNRSCRIALLHYLDGSKSYILCAEGMKVGDKVTSGDKCEQLTGNSMCLSNIALGTPVHNVELQRGRGGQLARSAGSAAVVQAKEGVFAYLLLSSGEIRKVNMECRATIGRVGHSEHSQIVHGKAGRRRWLGRKPHSRGSAMNPHDHPMGGGEGRRSGGRDPQSPTGVLAKGGKTRSPRKVSGRFIVRRRKGKK
ncbi:MAG: 50S ribosomal protein L2 [Planctomycetota bacterium]